MQLPNDCFNSNTIMRTFFLIFILLSFSACKTKTESTTHYSKKPIKTECPDKGECSILLLENKQLIIKTEEATGFLYPEVTNGNSLVIVFSYGMNSAEDTVDGNYSESIHFEIPRDFSELNKKNKELADVHLLYGKQCFCEDAGYYKVENGKLIIKKQDANIHLDLTFQVDGIDSKVQHIIETIELN